MLPHPNARARSPRGKVAFAVASGAFALAGSMVAWAPCAAQSANGEVTTGGATTPLKAITIERHDVFDLKPSSAWYEKVMNGLHVMTHESVIRRELLLRPGTPYDSARAAETARNLRKLMVFREVRVDSARSDTAFGARVVTGDAFTLKPYVSFRSSGGQATYGIGLMEQNLFGRLIGVDVKFKHEPDRDTLRFGLNAPRLIRDLVSVSGSFARMTDGEQSTFSVGMPFLSLASKSSANVSGDKISGRVLRYRNGLPDPSDSLQRRFGIIRLLAGLATRSSDRGYLRWTLEGQARRDDFSPDTASRGSIGRSVTGAIALFAEASRAQYVVTRNYRNIGPEEDVDLSTRLRAGVSFAPKAWGYEHNGLGPAFDFLTGRNFRGGFTFLNAKASSLFGSAGLDSGTFTLSSTTVVQPMHRHMAVFFIGGGMDDNPYPGEEFDLGLVKGPRAFPQHAFTGDRAVFGTAEYRWTAIPELYQLIGVGVAGFFDYGGAWFHGDPRRDGMDVGFGLRIGSARFPSINGAARIDAAYRFDDGVNKAGWVLVLGTGFVFEKPK